ncbi:MAG: thioesterase [Bacteroidetes bacterium]|nr:MAG: thioesterase [Bacteroidota bacterium]
MTRSKLVLPQAFSFVTKIPVRITDLNYGGHVGNDNILSIIHEARVQFLRSKSYSEMNIEGISLIMHDVVIEFKNELFYGDEIKAFVTAAEPSKIGFDIYYKFEKEKDGAQVQVVFARTGMVCYDYNKNKIASLPAVAKEKLMQ